MTKERKDNITVCSALAMLIFGCVLTTIAFFLEPMGVIHDSVLWVLGQCFLYAGGALGIANYARTSAKQEVDDYMRRHHRPHRAEMEEQNDETETETDGEEG